jgi:matrixin
VTASLRRLAVALVALAASPLYAFQLETTDDPDCDEAPGVDCPHNGTPLQWKASPVLYFINSDQSGLSFRDVRTAVNNAFSTWQSASGNNIQYLFAGQTHSNADGNDGQNTVTFVHLGSKSADTFGQSTITFSSHTGEIFDVDIELNADEPFAILPAGEVDPSDPNVDVQAVVTHESGHFGGLAHENRLGPEVVMFFSDISGNTTHRTLTSDDRSGIRAVYPDPLPGSPDGGSSGGGGGGGGGCRLDPTASPLTAFPTIVTVALLAVVRRMRRT